MNRSGTALRDAAVRAACEWLVTLEDEAATPEERRRFADWLLESSLHVREFMMAEYTWWLLEEALTDAGCPDACNDAGSKVVPIRTAARARGSLRGEQRRL